MSSVRETMSESTGTSGKAKFSAPPDSSTSAAVTDFANKMKTEVPATRGGSSAASSMALAFGSSSSARNNNVNNTNSSSSSSSNVLNLAKSNNNNGNTSATSADEQLSRIVVFSDGRIEGGFSDGTGIIIKKHAVTYFRADGQKRRFLANCPTHDVKEKLRAAIDRANSFVHEPLLVGGVNRCSAQHYTKKQNARWRCGDCRVRRRER
jgi:hypothetical protein